MNSALSIAHLFKLTGTGAWRGVHTTDTGTTTNFRYLMEMNPSNQMAADTGAAGWATAATFTNTTDFGIYGWTWDGTNTAGGWVWRWKVGAGAWASETETATGRTGAAGPGYHHIIGNEAANADDGRMDWVCGGFIEANLSQATFESLSQTSFAAWESVFTGANAGLWGAESISTLTDRTGNGADETSRSAGITLVSDPAGWSWGTAADNTPKPATPGMFTPQLVPEAWF